MRIECDMFYGWNGMLIETVAHSKCIHWNRARFDGHFNGSFFVAYTFLINCHFIGRIVSSLRRRKCIQFNSIAPSVCTQIMHISYVANVITLLSQMLFFLYHIMMWLLS